MLAVSDARRRDGPPARPTRPPSTISSPASRTTATGTACSAGSTCPTCGSRRSPGSSPPRTSRPAICPSPSAIRRDVDLDDRDEVVLAGPGQFVTVKLEEGGGIARWDLRAAAHPLAAVMRRRPEAYHQTLRAPRGERGRPGRRGDADVDDDGPASIHDIVRVKQPGLLAHLHLRRLRAALRPDPDPAERNEPGRRRCPEPRRARRICATEPGRSRPRRPARRRPPQRDDPDRRCGDPGLGHADARHRRWPSRPAPRADARDRPSRCSRVPPRSMP